MVRTCVHADGGVGAVIMGCNVVAHLVPARAECAELAGQHQRHRSHHHVERAAACLGAPELQHCINKRLIIIILWCPIGLGVFRVLECPHCPPPSAPRRPAAAGHLVLDVVVRVVFGC